MTEPILYLTGCTNPLTEAAAQTQPRLGMLAQPGNNLHGRAGRYAVWGIDCGAFGHARQVAKGNAEPWGDDETFAYLAYLTGIAASAEIAPRFAVTPDVLRFVCLTHDVADTARPLSCRLAYEKVSDADGARCQGVPIGDAAATWAQSLPVFDLIREVGLSPALVAQDGILDTDVDWDRFDALFIGGSDAFKLGRDGVEITRRALDASKWVHMGRVNSGKRLAYASAIGCDSADGTYIGFGPNVNVPKVLGWLDATSNPLPFAA